MGEIRRDQRRVLQEKRGVIAPGCALEFAEDSCLRLLEDSEASELHALIDGNRERLARWLPWAAAQTLKDTREFIATARDEATRDASLQAAVVCAGRIVGSAGCVSVNWADRSTNIGYWLGEEFQGRGTMTAAVRALTDHAISVWELNRVEIRVATQNRSSRAIPERLGFCEEGVLRQAHRIGDRYVDLAVYGMPADDWAGGGPATAPSS